MLAFEPVTVQTALRLGDCFAAQPFRACDYTVGAVFQWRAYFSSAVAFCGPMAILRADYPGEGQFYMFPVGAPASDAAALETALSAIETDAAERGVPLQYCAVPEEGVAALCARYGDRAVCTPHRDWADYLYNLSDLQTFPGKPFHGKRGHLNRFLRENPGSRYMAVTAETLPRAQAFLAGYARHAELDKPIEREEMFRSMELLDRALPLGLKAGFVETADGAIVALAIGEVIGDTLYVHVEKAVLDVPGAYQAIVSAFAVHAAKPDTRYCNREDDSGEEGLRRSKESYQPIRLIDKYWVAIGPNSQGGQNDDAQ